jgi:hypothetical protein
MEALNSLTALLKKRRAAASLSSTLPRSTCSCWKLAFQLHVDVGEGLVDPLPQADEAVIDEDGIDGGGGDDAEDDPTHERLLRERTDGDNARARVSRACPIRKDKARKRVSG